MKSYLRVTINKKTYFRASGAEEE